MTLGVTGIQRSKWLEKLAYKLSSGQERRRAKSYDLEHGRESEPWSTIVLTSSEEPLSDQRRGRQRGSTVRFIEVPALFAGGGDIFDRLEVNRATDRGEDVDTLSRLLTHACTANHGRAFEHYAEHLIEHRADLPDRIAAAMTRFRDHVEHPATDSPMTRNLARRFGVIYAGAVLAIAAGTVPWREANALASVAAAYHASRKRLPDDALELRKGLARLVKSLQALPSTRTWHRQARHERPSLEVGYHWPSNAGHIALFRTEAFVNVFENEPQQRLVERFLIERGLVALARPRSATSGPRLKEQHTWLNGDRPRSLQICVPWGGFYKAA